MSAARYRVFGPMALLVLSLQSSTKSMLRSPLTPYMRDHTCHYARQVGLNCINNEIPGAELVPSSPLLEIGPEM